MQTSRGGQTVQLLARTVDEYIHRCATAAFGIEAKSQPVIPSRSRTRTPNELSCNEWHRALCEEDAAESTDSIASAAGSEGSKIYGRGAYRSSGLSTVDAYLTRNVGMFPDVVERLALNHVARGDHMSALITAEWWAI